MDPTKIKHIIEACLLVAGREMSIPQLEVLFDIDEEASARPARKDIADALQTLQADYEGRGIELVEVASGWRLQSRTGMEPWVSRLFQEKTPRYSRALLETLVLVAYRQPITRGEIEDVRGVAVSSNIIKTLQEREWVREVGHKDVPGKPALLGTTRKFLDYFNLERLEDLPTLGELKDLDGIDAALAASGIGDVGDTDGDAANDAGESGDADDAETVVDSQATGAQSDDAVGLVLPDSHEVDLAPFQENGTVTGEDGEDGVDAAPLAGADVTSEALQPTDALIAGAAIEESTRADETDEPGALGGLSTAVDSEMLSDESRRLDDADDVGDAMPLDSASAHGGSTRVDESDESGTLAELSTAVDSEILSDESGRLDDAGSAPVLNGAEAMSDGRVSPDDASRIVPGESKLAQPLAEAPAEPYEDPQARLRRVIDRFAADHRADLEAQGRPTVPTLPSDELRDPDAESVDAAAPDRDDRVP